MDTSAKASVGKFAIGATHPGIVAVIAAGSVSLVLAACGGGDGPGMPGAGTFTSRFNDTGVTNMQCYIASSDTLNDCSSTAATGLSPAQDGMVGRDANAATNSDIDGSRGFSFTKIDANGGALPATAHAWICVKDNVTGLVWEMKTPGNTAAAYTNYDSTTALQINGVSAPTQGQIDAATNSVGYKNAVNGSGLCGARDWRLPTAEELQGIVNYGRHSPSIDDIWFPNTQANYYWSSSPDSAGPANAWGVYFDHGMVSLASRAGTHPVRLVRAGQ